MPPITSILFADDDPDDVFLFKSAVKETCPTLELTIASDGMMLLDLLTVLPVPDVIFLDINMPIKNGMECLKEIRQKNEFTEVKIIMLSTSNSKSDIEFCMLNGADHYIVKPADYDDLKSIILDLCDGKLLEVKKSPLYN